MHQFHRLPLEELLPRLLEVYTEIRTQLFRAQTGGVITWTVQAHAQLQGTGFIDTLRHALCRMEKMTKPEAAGNNWKQHVLRETRKLVNVPELYSPENYSSQVLAAIMTELLTCCASLRRYKLGEGMIPWREMGGVPVVVGYKTMIVGITPDFNMLRGEQEAALDTMPAIKLPVTSNIFGRN